MVRARLVRGQTCSSTPEVGVEAELAWSTGDGASGDVFVTAVTCIAAFLCFLAFFLAALLICNTCSQFKRGHWVKFRCFIHIGAGVLKLLLVHKSNLWSSNKLWPRKELLSQTVDLSMRFGCLNKLPNTTGDELSATVQARMLSCLHVQMHVLDDKSTLSSAKTINNEQAR